MAFWAAHIPLIPEAYGAKGTPWHPFVVKLFSAFRAGQPRSVMETPNARKHEISDDCNDHQYYRDSNFNENIHKGQGFKSATVLNISGQHAR
ncbi:MAG TPA: hypothetical protein VK487_06750 [Candidatus Bathyarchaeia archaeon]|nr:hypothetical protein [Candidatus Bathyarchaeia archaeon]